MKKRILTIVTMVCLILCCNISITARAEDTHKHSYTQYGEHCDHWTTPCTIHPNCTIAVNLDKVTYVCACGHSYVKYYQTDTHYTK